jgi:tryptophan-rich sensory protein
MRAPRNVIINKGRKMAVTPFEEFEVLACALLFSLVGLAISWLGFRGAERLWCSLYRPGYAPSVMLIRIFWIFFYLGLGVAFYLVRRTAPFQDILVSFILFILLVLFLSFWPWLFFQFRQLRFSAFYLILVIPLAIATCFFFLVQNHSGTIGAIIIILVFCIGVLFLLFLLVTVFWISSCSKNVLIAQKYGCRQNGRQISNIERGIPPGVIVQPQRQAPNFAVGTPTRPIISGVTTNPGSNFAFGSQGFVASPVMQDARVFSP